MSVMQQILTVIVDLRHLDFARDEGNFSGAYGQDLW